MTDHRESCAEALPLLVAGAETLGVSLSGAQRTQFVHYCHLLADSNTRINLTAVRSAPGIMRALLLDSLTIAPLLPEWLRSPSETPRVIDIGSGAGIPGLPLKIVHPHWRLTLVESVGKKARFLQQVAEEMQLSDVVTVNERAEGLGHRQDFRDCFDLCLARAVAGLPSLIELCAPFVRPGGLLAFPKGADAAAEVDQGRAAARRLRVDLLGTHTVPEEVGLGPERFVVVYQKLAVTPAGYPRRVGLAQSRPLRAGDRSAS